MPETGKPGVFADSEKKSFFKTFGGFARVLGL